MVPVALLLLTLASSRGEAKPPKPPPVSNPEIVYQCEGICVANRDGTARYNILPYGSRPNWCGQGGGISADPYKIVFEDPFGVMHVLDLVLVNGVPTVTSVAPLVTPFDANRPEFSPMCDRVISAQYFASFDGGRVWATPAVGGDSTVAYQAEPYWSITNATWRSDVSKIAFSLVTPYPDNLSPECPSLCASVWVMNVDGSGLQQVTPWYEGTAMGAGAGLEWSPTDDLIAFNGGDGISIVDVSDPSSPGIMWLFEGHEPSWSPDGTKLVYDEGPSFIGKNIYVFDLVTGRSTLIMRNVGNRPRWRN